MKKIIFIITFIIILIANSGSSCFQHQILPPSITTLDSLQGKWLRINDDSLTDLVVNGRYWNERYNSILHPIYNDLYIYFSDTIVDNSLLFNQIKIDTNSLSGKFIVSRSLIDNSIDCWSLNGFRYKAPDTTFAIMPPEGRAKNVQLFKKIQ